MVSTFFDVCSGGCRRCYCFQTSSWNRVLLQKKPTVLLSSLWVPVRGAIDDDGALPLLVTRACSSSRRRKAPLLLSAICGAAAAAAAAAEDEELWVCFDSRTGSRRQEFRPLNNKARVRSSVGEHQIRKAVADEEEEEEELGETTDDDDDDDDVDDMRSLEKLLRRDRNSDGRIQLEANPDPSVIAMLLLEDKNRKRRQQQEQEQVQQQQHQQQQQQKKRSLPIPMPHKLRRPLPLPRPKSRLRTFLSTNYILKKQKKKEVASPPPPPQLLSKLVAAIRKLPVQESIANVLKLHKSRLQKGTLAAVILALGRENHVHRALQVFEWLQEQKTSRSASPPDETSLLAVLQVLIETRALERASELQGLYLPLLLLHWSPNAISKLGCLYAEAGYMKEAVDMLLACGEIDSKLYVSVIVNAGQAGEKKLVRALLRRTGNVPLRMEECTAVMAVCSKLGLEEEVEALFQHYKGLGFCPNVVIYTTVMSARSRAGKYREAVSLFWEMEETGCKPDLIAYQVMMGLCGKLKDVAKAAKLFNSMKDAGFSPTPDVYETLIQLYSEQGRMGKAKEVLKEMEMRGCSPTVNIRKCLSAVAGLKR